MLSWIFLLSGAGQSWSVHTCCHINSPVRAEVSQQVGRWCQQHLNSHFCCCVFSQLFFFFFFLPLFDSSGPLSFNLDLQPWVRGGNVTERRMQRGTRFRPRGVNSKLPDVDYSAPCLVPNVPDSCRCCWDCFCIWNMSDMFHHLLSLTYSRSSLWSFHYETRQQRFGSVGIILT